MCKPSLHKGLYLGQIQVFFHKNSNKHPPTLEWPLSNFKILLKSTEVLLNKTAVRCIHYNPTYFCLISFLGTPRTVLLKLHNKMQLQMTLHREVIARRRSRYKQWKHTCNWKILATSTLNSVTSSTLNKKKEWPFNGKEKKAIAPLIQTF